MSMSRLLAMYVLFTFTLHSHFFFLFLQSQLVLCFCSVFFFSKLHFYYVLCEFQYDFEGRYDLVRFIKLIQKAGLYAHLRIGPYVCAEWNFGYLLCFFSLDPILSFSLIFIRALDFFYYCLCLV